MVAYPPINTVGQPGGRIFPVGAGIGAPQLAWAVVSPTRAAGSTPISTVPDPFTMFPGPPGTQPGNEQGAVIAVTVVAGLLPIKTLGCPLIMANGKGGWGVGVGVGAGGCIGA